MEATEKNAQTVNTIIKVLEAGDYTIEEAYSILNFTKGRIKHTSKVGFGKALKFSSSVQMSLTTE